MTWLIEQIYALSIADLVTIVSPLIGVWAVIQVFRWQPKRVLMRMRMRYIIPRVVPNLRWWKARRIVKKRVKGLLRHPENSVDDELQFIWSLLKSARGGEVWHFVTKNEECQKEKEWEEHLQLSGSLARHVGKAYEEYSARLRASSMLGIALAPVILTDANRAIGVARKMFNLAAGVELSGDVKGATKCAIEFNEYENNSEWKCEIDYLVTCSPEQGILSLDLCVTYIDRLYAPVLNEEGKDEEGKTPQDENQSFRELSVPSTVSDLLRKRLKEPGIFNGLIARLASYRLERDDRDGRVRLRLGLEKTNYAGWLAAHNVGFQWTDSKTEISSSYFEHLLRLSDCMSQLAVAILVETRDGKLVLTRRSAHTDTMSARVMPSANGNIQFASTGRTIADFDDDGVPDPLRAMKRELEEELGLKTDSEAIRTLGLGRFRTPKEINTHVLVGLVQVPLTVEEIVEGVRYLDPASGGWETTGEVLALDIDSFLQSGPCAWSFIRESSDLAAHTRVALGLFLMARMKEESQQIPSALEGFLCGESIVLDKHSARTNVEKV